MLLCVGEQLVMIPVADPLASKVMLYRKFQETKGLDTHISTIILRNTPCFTGTPGWSWNRTINRASGAGETACLPCE